MVDLTAMLTNLGSAFPYATKLVLVLCAVVGIAVVGFGGLDLYNRAAAPERHNRSGLAIIAKFLIGGAMVSAAVLMWQVGNTLVLTGGDPTGAFSYLPPTNNTGLARCEALRSVVLLFFVFLGAMAYFRGFTRLYRAANGHERVSGGKITTLFVAGTICIFFTPTTNVIGNTLGLNAGIDQVCKLLGPRP